METCVTRLRFALGLALFTLIPGVCGLQCYNCWWSHDPNDYTKENDKSELKIKELTYPVSDRYIGKYVTHTPGRDDLHHHCIREECMQKNSACLTWSFISSNPVNITYMCVGNPSRRSGCYQQEIPNKDKKQFLRVEACLCNTHLCNTAASASSMCILVIGSIVVVMLTNKLTSLF